MAAVTAWYLEPGHHSIRQISLRCQNEGSRQSLNELYRLIHTNVIDGQSCPAIGDDPNAIYMLYFDDEATFKRDVPFNEAASKLLSKLPIPWKTYCGWFIITKVIQEHAVDDSVEWSEMELVEEKAVDMDEITPGQFIRHWNKMKG